MITNFESEKTRVPRAENVIADYAKGDSGDIKKPRGPFCKSCKRNVKKRSNPSWREQSGVKVELYSRLDRSHEPGVNL